MLHLYATLSSLFVSRDEKGATATEYALIVAGIALVIIVAVGLFGTQLNGIWERIGDSLDGL